MSAQPRRMAAVLLAALALVGAAVTPAAAAPRASGDPAARTQLLQFGVTTPGGPAATDELDGVAASAGTQPAIVLFYADFTTPPPIAGLDAVAARGATPLVTWEPWQWGATDQARFSLASIAAGRHDGYLRQWADALRAWGRPVRLRFAHEQNGTWYPWAVGSGGTTAAQHVSAWRHVVQLFRDAGAANVTFVWNPNVSFPGSSPIGATWPGKRYVDVVGLDGYNWGTSTSWTAWQTPQQLFDASLRELRGLAPRTPILISEVASAEAGGDKAAWIRALVAHLDAQSDVTGFVWFDHDKETDWRIASSPASAEALRAALAARTAPTLR
ncbi:glycoside hydrolase family 26 protein [Geodermatophilus ruber]|uniref:Glycosyl hydrolase family 26 n=1 Tax=Geodermatophilus ruber TaxID=504800 RepID=A0A1I3ZDI5_9ACTN|nr:glycosyl hydrolase [Geodermatophilus ruber]SFK42052.1 Glycosyl hydrolase family 26 [Geodermatophilus ruber]